MFVVHLDGGDGGCDHTIGCNMVVIELPEKITTMAQARDYIFTDAKNSSHKPGMVHYYGIDNVQSVTIYEIKEKLEVDMPAYLKILAENKRAAEQAKKDEADRKEFERLKKKFEGGQ
jgi:thiamine phosphate synthase YjbQ (UPF0047 family)